MTGPKDLSWMDRGACRDSDIEFAAPSRDDIPRAKRICRGCPVLNECDAFGLTLATGNSKHYTSGIYGGRTATERARIRKASRR